MENHFGRVFKWNQSCWQPAIALLLLSLQRQTNSGAHTGGNFFYVPTQPASTQPLLAPAKRQAAAAAVWYHQSISLYLLWSYTTALYVFLCCDLCFSTPLSIATDFCHLHVCAGCQFDLYTLSRGTSRYLNTC